LQKELTQNDTVVPENKYTKCTKNDDVGENRGDNGEGVLKTTECEGDGGFEIIYKKKVRTVLDKMYVISHTLKGSL
jgi:hypothetical protein